MDIGLAFAFIASIFFGLSTVMQKHVLRKMKKFSVFGMLRSAVWLVSIGVGAIGMLLYVLAVGMQNITSVQSIITLSLIIPVVSGALLFRERIGAEKWLSILLVIIGIAAIIL